QAASHGTGFRMASSDEGWQITSSTVQFDYVSIYAPLTVRREGVYRFEITYRIEQGDITFGALDADKANWLAQAGPGNSVGGTKPAGLRKSFTVPLKAGSVFWLLIANNHPQGAAASRFVLKELRAYLQKPKAPGEEAVSRY